MNCPFCKHPGADDRNYCGACGGSLVQYCRLCGYRNGGADRYCGGCGHPLSDAPAAATPAPRAAASAGEPEFPPEPPSAGLGDLLEAARETQEVAQEETDVKVSQDDIDSLFGD